MPKCEKGGGPLCKDGVDVWMTDDTIWWFTIVWLALLTIGWIVYAGVFINSQPILHTYFKNPGMPGILNSLRYHFNWIIISLSILCLGLWILFMFLMIIFRENYGCHMTWFLLSVLFLAVMIFVIVGLSIQYGSCNQANEPNNICNDFRWCCVHTVDPANECPNFGVCPGITQDDLAPNDQFLGLFWTLIVLTFLYVVWFIVLIVYWFSPPPPEQVNPSAPTHEAMFLPPEKPQSPETEQIKSHYLLSNDDNNNNNNNITANRGIHIDWTSARRRK